LSAFINNSAPANQVLNQHTLGISNVLDYKLRLRSGDMVNLTSILSSTDKP
jgi:hypothetical protein